MLINQILRFKRHNFYITSELKEIYCLQILFFRANFKDKYPTIIHLSN